MDTITWSHGKVLLLDQTRLPAAQVILEISDYRELIEAIKGLRIRGAPAIGVAAAYGVVLGARSLTITDQRRFLAELRRIGDELIASRPTAVNLAWAVRRMLHVAEHGGTTIGIATALLAEAQRIQAEDVEANRRIGAFGAPFLPRDASVLTHCNTGSLATAGYGTALGVIRSARDQGKTVRVVVTETRPLLQGARLTTWELLQDGIAVTLITDSMAGAFLASKKIDCVLVGADRIAMNGDLANKVGTYTLAVLAKENNVPFYVAAPISTIDPGLPSGEAIPIEERPPEEVTRWGGVQIAPEGVRVANPAFDVTPHRYLTAIITDRGIAQPPFAASLRRLLECQP